MPGMTVVAAVFLKTVIRRDVLVPGMRNDSKEQIHHDPRNNIGGCSYVFVNSLGS